MIDIICWLAVTFLLVLTVWDVGKAWPWSVKVISSVLVAWLMSRLIRAPVKTQLDFLAYGLWIAILSLIPLVIKFVRFLRNWEESRRWKPWN